MSNLSLSESFVNIRSLTCASVEFIEGEHHEKLSEYVASCEDVEVPPSFGTGGHLVIASF